jgi:hypothetical protein
LRPADAQEDPADKGHQEDREPLQFTGEVSEVRARARREHREPGEHQHQADAFDDDPGGVLEERDHDEHANGRRVVAPDECDEEERGGGRQGKLRVMAGERAHTSGKPDQRQLLGYTGRESRRR